MIDSSVLDTVTVLVIEDEEAQVELVRRYLNKYPKVEFNCLWCSSLKEALETIPKERHRISILLVDLNLPDSSGLETLKQLQETCPNLPKVLMTSVKDENVALEASRMGIEFYFSKSELVDHLLARSLYLIYQKSKLKTWIDIEQMKTVQKSKFSMLGEMSSGIAHEIVNPLSVILARAQQLGKAREEDGQINRTVQSIEKMVSRIQKIIVTMRNFARDTSDDCFEPVHFSKILEDTLELCQEKIRAHGVDLIVEGQFSETMIECREIEISQVLLNLVNNAIDAIKEQKERWVKIYVEVTDEYLTVRVKDAGPEIPADLKEQILQPFFTTKKVGEGSGIGLSVSKNIIERHHGKLYLNQDSAETEFVFEIPLRNKI